MVAGREAGPDVEVGPVIAIDHLTDRHLFEVAPFRLDRQGDGEWRSAGFYKKRPDGATDPVEGAHITVVEAGHAGNVVVRDGRPSLDLQVFGRRVFELKLRFVGKVFPAAFAETLTQ